MSKLRKFIEKVCIVASLIIMFQIIGHLSLGTTSASVELNTKLINENLMLRDEYDKLTRELEKIEEYIDNIQKLDNMLYAQVLGVNIDMVETKSEYKDTTSFILKPRGGLFVHISERVNSAAGMLASQMTRMGETSIMFNEDRNSLDNYPTISPIKNSDFIRVSSVFGLREHPIRGGVVYHDGIDIAAIEGTSIFSTARGHVVDVLYSDNGYGNRLIIKHQHGFETVYAHMDEISVVRGQWVNKNQKIGTVGNTGTSTGPHLHYEVRINDELYDPLRFFHINLSENMFAMN